MMGKSHAQSIAPAGLKFRYLPTVNRLARNICTIPGRAASLPAFRTSLAASKEATSAQFKTIIPYGPHDLSSRIAVVKASGCARPEERWGTVVTLRWQDGSRPASL